jgi:NAD(P)-dependent dehydrogenase (short-subunit alcohol dehydrogenase family)
MTNEVNLGRYAGRYALITGGANGLGFATAVRLAREGATIGVLDVVEDAIESAVENLRREGYAAEGYPADVSDEAAVKNAIGSFHEQFGQIDILATFAAIFPVMPFADMTLETWKRVLAVNLDGTFIPAHAVMPIMKEQNYGRIVTISSGQVLLAMVEHSAYTTSKAGVIGLTRILAREGGPHNVTANCVLPGYIATEASTNLANLPITTEELFELVIAGQCVKRRGEPEDIAEAVAYLASEAAGFVTGQSLSVGGGDRFL